MAVKTTKIQCNQDVDLRGKADIEGKVTCGSNVDVDGTLTINSAKDLKTKDGSSIGGSDTSPWKVIPSYEMWGFENTNDGTNTYYGISGDSFTYIATNTSQDNPIDFQVGFIPLGGITPSIGIYSFIDYISGITSKITVPDDFVTKSQVINLGDINKNQAPPYHHTITLHDTTIPGYFTFSIDNRLQSEITKETLFNVLNGHIVVGTGFMQNILIDKISFGTTADETKVHQFADLGLRDSIDAEVTFEEIFERDYTLEDVTYPN